MSDARPECHDGLTVHYETPEQREARLVAADLEAQRNFRVTPDQQAALDEVRRRGAEADRRRRRSVRTLFTGRR